MHIYLTGSIDTDAILVKYLDIYDIVNLVGANKFINKNLSRLELVIRLKEYAMNGIGV